VNLWSLFPISTQISVTSGIQDVTLIGRGSAKFKRSSNFVMKDRWVGRGSVYTHIILNTKQTTGVAWF
jgi:hypothetical protein